MSFPSMTEAMSGWTTKIVLRLVNHVVQDFEAKETEIRDVTFKGVLQPVPPQKLMVKPEGQRNWRWWTLWTKQNLDTDAIVIDPLNHTFRVMSRSDWGNAGFHEYELTEGPPAGGFSNV